MSKFFGFILGVAVALAGPAAFGVLAADGGFELNAKEMALAYGIGALIFWAVISYFAGAAALGAALTFGAMIYAVHWIPNRTTNFLNDIPGVTTGMIDGIKQYTLNGVVPILAVISLVYAIQLIVRTVQRRRRERAELERAEREQELAQAQQESEATAAYPVQNPANPVAGGDYPTMVDNRLGNRYGNTSYDDLFDEDPEPLPPRNVAGEQPTQFGGTPGAWAEAGADADETVLVPTDRDETEVVPTTASTPAGDETVAISTNQPETAPAQPTQAQSAQAEAVEAESADADAAQPETAPAGPARAEDVGGAQGDGEPGKAEGADRPKPAESEAVNRPAAGPSPQPPVAEAAAQAPQPSVVESSAGAQGAPVVEAVSQAQEAPVVEAVSQAPVVERAVAPRVEEVGQQYRERMDGPEFDTGEFPAFENPVVPEDERVQAPRIMPGHVRPAGA